MSSYQEYHQRKAEHEAKIRKELAKLLEDFSSETGAPVTGLDVYFSGAAIGERSSFLIRVEIRTEG